MREAFAHSTPGRLHGLPHRAAMTGEKRRMRRARSCGVDNHQARAVQGLCAASLVATVAATSTITDPAQCSAPLCCVVLFRLATGAQCNPVPIWDFQGWTHPGGPFVTAAPLCGTVRFDWLGRSGSHSAANPETGNSLGTGAMSVGTFTDPSCATNPGPRRFFCCLTGPAGRGGRL